LDRFMLKVTVDYPSRNEEKQILERFVLGQPEAVNHVVTTADIMAARNAVREVHLEESLRDYIVHVVYATREPESYRLADIGPHIAYGASPRASIFLAQAARAYAFIDGRGYVTPDDVKAIAQNVLRHRVIVTYEAEAEDVTSQDIVQRVLDTVPVP
ncbi:MAG: MoxR family ATPase, partial [Chloroflexi bacterium]|nr:MoxR family ATPase [Chloroflexota bacterium]